jgi:hypothetical protein
MKLTKILKPACQEPWWKVAHRWLCSLWRGLNKPDPSYNHYCRGESGNGEWCHRSELPSVCGYCKEPNAALKAERHILSNTETTNREASHPKP